ncbi:hypothetical protein D1115_06395 [Vibrio alfacsensis]|uniref:Protein kinase domain-containing protein n=1 Tax=Vibrio alfacsensis TaxID=1074311 RepID=A0ABN5PI23_9VIBR|nr:hypothetical protein [Vibrio alfacsensis]AXY00910.1 hypothetical protein D1115_06395 [Vibrio alfacsensis]
MFNLSNDNSTVLQTVFDFNGESRQLGKELARGGEGCVYPLSINCKILTKIYHSDYLGDKERMDKINAMIKLYKSTPSLSKLPVAWPQLAVFDEQRIWQGYAMKAADGIKLSVFKVPKLVRKYFPEINRTDVIEILQSLLKTAEQLHSHGIYMGDINLDNFLVEPQTKLVSFIDCDSYQVSIQGQHFPCPVGTDSMIPPEHQGQNLSSVVRNVYSDTFSLTIICFMLLMSGRHPYEHIGGESISHNIRIGHFPWGQSIRPGSNGAVPVGPWYNWWSHLSGTLKGAFIQTFTAGSSNVSERVPLSELRKLLSQYKYSIEKGYLSNEMWPNQAKNK